jgi:hypothetical protein
MTDQDFLLYKRKYDIISKFNSKGILIELEFGKEARLRIFMEDKGNENKIFEWDEFLSSDLEVNVLLFLELLYEKLTKS